MPLRELAGEDDSEPDRSLRLCEVSVTAEVDVHSDGQSVREKYTFYLSPEGILSFSAYEKHKANGRRKAFEDEHSSLPDKTRNWRCVERKHWNDPEAAEVNVPQQVYEELENRFDWDEVRMMK